MVEEAIEKPLIIALWHESWLKTLILIFSFLRIQVGIIFKGIFNPITLKLAS
jgi:hypothetical protein